MVRKNSNARKIKYNEDLAIIAKTNPFIGICLAITFFSIAGVPPLAGFFSKYLIILETLGNHYILLAIIAILASSIAIFYYIRIIK